MPSFMKFAAAALAVAAPLASAQTYTSCNPLDKTCPADAGTTESNLSFDFTQSGSLDKWTTTAGTVNTGANGAEFTINKRGDAPTIETDFYIFFGEISITMKAAHGTGIVSSLVFESDDLDEIDWVSAWLWRDTFSGAFLTSWLYRKLWAATAARSRPTTSARVTPRRTIAPLGLRSPIPRIPGTRTRSRGRRMPSPGTLTAMLSAP